MSAVVRSVRLSGFPVALGLLSLTGGCAESSGQTQPVTPTKAPTLVQQLGSHRLRPGDTLEEDNSVTVTFTGDSPAKTETIAHTIARTIAVQKVNGMGVTLYEEKITRDQNSAGGKEPASPGTLTGRTLVFQRETSSWTRTVEKAGEGEPKPAANVSKSDTADFANDGYFPMSEFRRL